MVVIPNNRNIPPDEKDCAKATTQVKNATIRKIPSYSHDMCYNRIIHGQELNLEEMRLLESDF